MEYSKNELLSIYESIEEERKQRDEYISMLQKKDAEIQVKILEYRIASISRILKYIKYHQEEIINDNNKLDIYLTHCCNKLSGNLDGVEINLKEEENENT